MELIEDYTFFISNIPGSPDHPFMFVSPSPSPYPPLGERNWKQGKIGVGPDSTLYPGGQGGVYPYKGVFNITVRTNGHSTQPNTISIVPTNGTIPYVRFRGNQISSMSSSNYTLYLHFTENVTNFNESKLAIGQGSRCVDAVDEGWIENSHVFRCNVVFNMSNSGEISVTANEGLAVSTSSGAPSTESSSFSFLRISESRLNDAEWENLITLRDNSQVLPDPHNDMLSGGWYVTPIHAVMIPSTNKLLLSGWIRRDGMPCYGGERSGGRRRASVSFEVDIGMLEAAASSSERTLHITRVEENAEFPFEDTNAGVTVEGQHVDGDAIYCAGHTHLEDGRVFYFGGAKYSQISENSEYEWGLDYARIFDPISKTFKRIDARAPLGRSWYPTTGRMSDGRILVTGAFIDYSSSTCYAPGTLWRPSLQSCWNPQVNIFDPQRMEWSVVLDHEHMDHDIDPGIREYTRIFVLPESVSYENRDWNILLLGKAGRVVLLDIDESTPMANRTFKPPNGRRPGDCGEASDQSTAVPLLTSRGPELMIVGGCTGDRNTMQMADIYNVRNDSWTRIETHIGRGVPASILLPDGRVLLVSGETPWVNQNDYVDTYGPSDARIPQILDPETFEVSFEMTGNTSDVFRGYHNMASLLNDGRIVVGGGFNQYGDVGCENPNLRIFNPSYYDPEHRPSLISSVDRFVLGQNDVMLKFEGVTGLDSIRGVALLAAQAFTHSYGQNQRYVKMEITSLTSTSVTFNVPNSPVLLTGPHHLFLLSDQGVPSVASPVLVVRHDDESSSRHFWVVFGVVTSVVLLLGIVYVVSVAQHGLHEDILEEENMVFENMMMNTDDNGDESSKSDGLL